MTKSSLFHLSIFMTFSFYAKICFRQGFVTYMNQVFEPSFKLISFFSVFLFSEYFHVLKNLPKFSGDWNSIFLWLYCKYCLIIYINRYILLFSGQTSQIQPWPGLHHCRRRWLWGRVFTNQICCGQRSCLVGWQA